MNNWIVYQHIFPNNKSYIGITCRGEARWGTKGQNYKDNQPLIYNAIQKYGWDNVKHNILQKNLSFKEAQEFEKQYIQTYHSYYLDKDGPGYNMTLGGEGGTKYDNDLIIELYLSGLTIEEVSNQLNCNPSTVSAALQGANIERRTNSKPISQFDLNGNYIASYPNARVAMESTGIDYKLISGVISGKTQQTYGYQWKEYDEKDKNGISPYKKHLTGQKARPVNQFDLKGNFIMSYESVAAAARAVGATPNNIRVVAQGKGKTSHGFIWRYADEENQMYNIQFSS